MPAKFKRTENYPKATRREDLERNCELLKELGAASCVIRKREDGWTVTTEWNKTPPGNPAFN